MLFRSGDQKKRKDDNDKKRFDFVYLEALFFAAVRLQDMDPSTVDSNFPEKMTESTGRGCHGNENNS